MNQRDGFMPPRSAQSIIFPGGAEPGELTKRDGLIKVGRMILAMFGSVNH